MYRGMERVLKESTRLGPPRESEINQETPHQLRGNQSNNLRQLISQNKRRASKSQRKKAIELSFWERKEICS
jgi:hypothetical protein